MPGMPPPIQANVAADEAEATFKAKIKPTLFAEGDRVECFSVFESYMETQGFTVDVEGEAGSETYIFRSAGGGPVALTVDKVKGYVKTAASMARGVYHLESVEQVEAEEQELDAPITDEEPQIVKEYVVDKLTIYYADANDIPGYDTTTVLFLANGSHVEQNEEFFDDPGGVTVRYGMESGVKAGWQLDMSFDKGPSQHNDDNGQWVNYALVDLSSQSFTPETAINTVTGLKHAVAVLRTGHSTTRVVVTKLNGEGYTKIHMGHDRPAPLGSAVASGDLTTVPKSELDKWENDEMDSAAELLEKQSLAVGAKLNHDGKRYEVKQVNDDDIVVQAME